MLVPQQKPPLGEMVGELEEGGYANSTVIAAS